MRKALIALAVLIVVGAFVPSASAQLGQNNLCNKATAIEYGDSATGSIDNSAFLVGFCFDGTAGDQVVISMEASSGTLDPYLQLSDNTGNDIYASNDDADANTRNAQIEFTLTTTGQHLIIATRYGADQGDSTGNFSLTLSEGAGKGTTNTTVPPKGPSTSEDQVVINITCDTGEQIVGGVQLSFIDVNPGFSYTVTAVGLDGFDPVVAVETQPGVGTCNDDANGAVGSQIAVPDVGSITAGRGTAQVRFTSPARGNPTNISVGSANGETGQYVLVIEGLAISPASELDGFALRVPDSVAEDNLSVYMISEYADLDPYLELYQGDGLTQAYDTDGNFYEDSLDYNNLEFILSCDDAGVNDCSNTPAFPGGGVDIANGSTYIAGDYDAGLLVTPNSSLPMLFVFGSYSGQTAGQYAIMVLGTVPGN
ncbi:MAG: PPC domain-containing protein [Chloroflexi bacterium]|nr:PPC domain-containing protein [Chloroflexota bacterium]